MCCLTKKSSIVNNLPSDKRKPDSYLTHPMHCPSTGPERSLLVRPSQSRPSPRTSYQLAAATKTQTTESGRRQKRQGYSDDIFSAINLHRISLRPQRCSPQCLTSPMARPSRARAWKSWFNSSMERTCRGTTMLNTI